MSQSLEVALEAEVRRVWADDSDGAHDLGHLRRVWRMAQDIADEEGLTPERDILMAAAFLHDVINLPKDAPNRAEAAALSARHATNFLTEFGFAAEKLPAVAHAIESHSYSAGVKPQTLEAKLLQDADRLEALGMIGLARWLYVSGSMGTKLLDEADPLAQSRPLNDRAFALDHLEVKLFRIAETMQTAAGRRRAEARVKIMRDFRDNLLAEIGHS
jgi:uncharacterized protein